ncbi:Gfo/Idh/MocA family protein [Halocatena marina]
MGGMIKQARVGIVGLGSMGQRHADLIRNTGHGVVIAGADIAQTAREEFEQRYGITAYSSHDELYEKESLDAVIVTTPNKFHETAVVAAFEQNINVLVEKPLAHTLDSARQIAKAAEASDAFGTVGFHSRFMPSATALRAYVERGDLGNITHTETNYVRRRGVPGRGTWFTSKEMAGGGALIDIGVHVIDLTLYLLGYPDITHVSGTTRQEFGNREEYNYLHMWGEDTSDGSDFDVEDSVTATLQTAQNQTISLDIAWANNGRYKRDISLRGTDAGATFDTKNGDLTLHESRHVGVDHHVDLEITTDSPDSKQEQTDRFLSAVQTGEPLEINTIDEALTVQRVVEAIYQSSEHNGHPICLKEGTEINAIEEPIMLG